MHYRHSAVWACSLLLLMLPALASAQQRTVQFVHGRLLDDATRQPIVDGSVLLLGANGIRVASAITDSLGRFRLYAPSGGEYRLKAERIGYRTGESPKINLGSGEVLPLDFWLSTRAVLLAPIEVRITARDWVARGQPPAIAPFYERMSLYSNFGGVFLTKESVREFDGSTVSEMLAAAAGGRPDGNGNITFRAGCSPVIFLNGNRFMLDPGDSLDRFFSPTDLEAVAVYKSAAALPGEFGGAQGQANTDGGYCAIVLWTRRT